MSDGNGHRQGAWDDLSRWSAAGEGATGEEVTAEELAARRPYARLGVADYLRTMTRMRCRLPDDRGHAQYRKDAARRRDRRRGSCLRRAGAVWRRQRDVRRPYDVREVIARVSTAHGRRVQERYAPTLVTGSRVCMASSSHHREQGVLFSESALKATHFIEMCNLRGIPLVFLQNITGFMVGRQYERGASRKDGAKMVPRGGELRRADSPSSSAARFGAGNYGMCGRAYEPGFLWMWPNARISGRGVSRLPVC